ncbi:MAG: cytochrome c biogenesis protein ResB [Streptosporangiales bacterium]|nr:cytochrome c biogenesis protein ResB [Streptosporangiales bacterium]
MNEGAADSGQVTTASLDSVVEPGADLGTTPAEPPPTRPRGGRLGGTLRWGWRQLTSMRTALVLLFLLALAAIPGSLVPQRTVSPSQVAQYFADHPDLAPVLDKLSAFDVFSAPWFAAIYLLLFVSLVGCIVPRSRAHLRQMRARPPAAPRNLGRLPHADRVETDATPAEATAVARAVLRARRFRVDVCVGERPSVAAEKGYLRETGNLLFHLALLLVLVAIAVGALFGYRGNVLVTEGDGFANATIAYDDMQKGKLFQDNRMTPFTLTLEKFRASYVARGEDRGTPERFDAYVKYRERPDGPASRYDLRVNAPLEIDDTKVYLLGHGYSPQFTVRDDNGRVVFTGAVPFVPQDNQTFVSEGVVKAVSASPQLGLQMFFLPTFTVTKQGPTSAFPAPLDPVVLMIAYEGDLGIDDGTPQSIFALDTSNMTQVRLPQRSQLMRPGQTAKLPGGRGSVEFTGLKEYAALQVNHDPGKGLALASTSVAIGALLLSLFIRRRRVWVRATANEAGGSVVEVGGLTRSEGAGGFAAEFTDLVDALRAELPPRDATTDEGADT